jgi:hypothetical protein
VTSPSIRVLLGSPCLPVIVYQCMTLHSIEYPDSATCGGLTVLPVSTDWCRAQTARRAEAGAHSDGRGVSPDRSHSDTSPGASMAVICAASTNVSEMIEMQNSLVSRIFWFVSSRQHGVCLVRRCLPLRPLGFLVDPLSTEIITVGGLLDTMLKFDIGASCLQRPWPGERSLHSCFPSLIP